jgi:hypothetical protein
LIQAAITRLSSRSSTGEKIYGIEGFNHTGTLLYTKGAINRETDGEVFYLLISSKVSTLGDAI